MSDLISRQAILKNIEKTRQSLQMMDDTHRAGIVMTGMHLCEEAVRNQPSAQPERKTGKWIDHSDEGYVECPFCHSATNCDGNKDELHYCFSCGADMRGEQDDS